MATTDTGQPWTDPAQAWPDPPIENTAWPDPVVGEDSGQPTAKTPETDKALASTGMVGENWLNFLKKPSPAWLQPFERTVKRVATTPPFQIPTTEQSPGYQKLAASILNPLAGFATIENTALGAAYAAQPEIGAALIAAKMAPSFAPWWQQIKRLPQMTPAQGLELGMQTWPLIAAPFIHAPEKPFKPAEPMAAPTGGAGYVAPQEFPVEEPSPGGVEMRPQAPPISQEELAARVNVPPETIARPEEAAPPAETETEEQAQARAMGLVRHYRRLGGEPEALLQDMIDTHPQNEAPSWGEYADELEDEIHSLTETPQKALESYQVGFAKARGMTPEEYQAEGNRRMEEARLRSIQQNEDAILSRRELEQEKQQPRKGGRYASRRGYAQMETGQAPLGIETRPGGKVPGASRGDYDVGEAQGKGARREVSQPVATGEPVAAAPPQPAHAPGESLELRNRAIENVRKNLGLPRDPVALLKLQEAGKAPSAEELKALQDTEYDKLTKPIIEAITPPAREAPAAGEGVTPGERRRAYSRVAPGRYEHNDTGLIVHRNTATGGWDIRHPETGEVLDNLPTRRAAIDAHITGAIPKAKPKSAPAPEAAPKAEAAPKPEAPPTEREFDFSDVSGFEKAIQQKFGRSATNEEKSAFKPIAEMVRQQKLAAEKKTSDTMAKILDLFKNAKDIPWEDAVKQVHEAIYEAVKPCDR